MYGGYGSSMYGGGYGRSMYGSSMYGGSMYGGGMGGMGGYGRPGQQESEFFAPKQSPDQLAQQGSTGTVAEIGDINTSFLDSLHSCGNGLYIFVMRLVSGLARLHAAVRTGTISQATARRVAAIALAAASLCMAGLTRAALRRRQQRLVFEAVFKRAAVAKPAVVPFPLPGFGVVAWGRPRAAL